MAFAGSIGASGALIPPAAIRNIQGEVGDSYDADDRIRFKTSSGQVYTPESVNTLFVAIADNGTPPLAALAVGNTNVGAADCGALVTDAPAANQNGLPANFGPGRGKWTQQRLRVTADSSLNVAVPAAGVGSVQVISAVGGGQGISVARNFHGEPLLALLLTVECLHSVQG